MLEFGQNLSFPQESLSRILLHTINADFDANVSLQKRLPSFKNDRKVRDTYLLQQFYAERFDFFQVIVRELHPILPYEQCQISTMAPRARYERILSNSNYVE